VRLDADGRLAKRRRSRGPSGGVVGARLAEEEPLLLVGERAVAAPFEDACRLAVAVGRMLTGLLNEGLHALDDAVVSGGTRWGRLGTGPASEGRGRLSLPERRVQQGEELLKAIDGLGRDSVEELGLVLSQRVRWSSVIELPLRLFEAS